VYEINLCARSIADSDTALAVIDQSNLAYDMRVTIYGGIYTNL